VESTLPVGKLVKQKIDWKRRFDHMQQHSGNIHVLIMLWIICRRKQDQIPNGSQAVSTETLHDFLQSLQSAVIVQAEIQTRHLSNTNQKCYHLGQVAWFEYCLDNHIKENMIGQTYSPDGESKKCMQNIFGNHLARQFST
jgi:Ser-tRNA(Ala) deacylase AlaX